MTLEQIERAVEELPAEGFAKLAEWMGQRQAKTADGPSANGSGSGADWFDTYMRCPESFDIPPRQKQFYKAGQ